MHPPLHREALVEQLVASRHEQNLSIRRAAALARVPASTAQGWFEGRHLPTPALMPNFLRMLEALGLATDAVEQEAWHRAITRMRSTVVIEESPYVGLRSYTPEESELYFGRARAYEALVAACLAPGARTVVVVGDSGSGKSSLLAAGLVGRGCAEGGPLAHLAPVRVAVADLPTFRAGSARTLLVVDQFEEAEQLDPEARTAVFDALASQPEHVLGVVALTAGSFGFAMRDQRFAEHLASPVLLGPLTTEEYTRIIEEPARRHGRTVAPELVDLALRDLHQFGDPSPGAALPLLSSALRRCWQEADGATITADDYLRTGGLWSALHDEAEGALLALPETSRAVAKRLILSMLRVDGEQIVRRWISLDSLTDDMRTTLEGFVRSRLLMVTDDAITISHDALLVHWGRLRAWVEEEQASLLVARRIHMAARLWHEGSRHEEALMHAEAELWSTWTQSADSPLLSQEETDFIEASLALAESRREEEHRQVQRLRRRHLDRGQGPGARRRAADRRCLGHHRRAEETGRLRHRHHHLRRRLARRHRVLRHVGWRDPPRRPDPPGHPRGTPAPPPG